MRLLLILFLVLVMFPTISNGQLPIDWIRNYDLDRQPQNFKDIYALEDGGLAACGVTHRRDGDQQIRLFQSAFVVYMDRDGDVIWQLRIGGVDTYEEFNALIEAENGDLILTGQRPTYPVGSIMAVRMSAEGELRWNRIYNTGIGNAVIELKSGEFLIAGTSSGSAKLICIDGNGEVIWEQSYRDEGASSSKFYALRETEGGVVAAGYSFDAGGYRWIKAAKVSMQDGATIWNRRYDDGEGSYWICNNITSDGEGGFALVGQAGHGNNETDILLLKINSQGEMLFSRRFDFYEGIDDELLDSGFGIERMHDGGYALAGFTVNGQLTASPVVVVTDDQGNERWRRTYRLEEIENYDVGNNLFLSTERANDGSIYLCGRCTYTLNEEGQNGLIIKLRSDFPEPQFIIHSPEDTVFTAFLNDSTEFWISARDNQDDDLSYLWTMLGDTISRDTLVTVLWEELGQQLVTCQVSDGENVASIRWHVTVSDLFIVSHSPDTLSLALRRGTSQTFSLDTVRAVEGDPVQYQWTLTNLDNFEREETGTEASATIAFLRSGNYQMEGLTYRGESSDNVIWTIAVRSAILDFWPRELRLSVPPDSSGEFGVIPFNPESDSLSYRWEMDGDSVGSDSTISLTFAWRGFPNPSYQVSVIVMDGAEGDTVGWEVTVREPEEVGKSESQKVEKWGILSVSPNPFNSTTTIRYSTSGDAYPTRLTVHDLTGRTVWERVGAKVIAGEHSYILNGADLPAGVYLVRLDIAGSQVIRKVVLLR